MKNIIAITFACLLGFAIGLSCKNCKPAQQHTTEWIGNPALRTGNDRFPNVGWLSSHEFGFRSDGVMVWRVTESQKKK